MDPKLCAQPTVINIILGSAIIVGLFLSFFFQWLVIVRRRSSEGISWITLTLSLVSGLLTTTNGMIFNWPTLSCCRFSNISVAACLEINLVTQSLLISPVCNIILFVLFLVFFSHKPLPNQTRREKQFDYLYSLVSFFGVLLTGFLIASMAFVLFFGGILTGQGIEYYGKTLGYMSGVATLFIWVPQIWTTFRTNNGGALSLPMLLIQGPGSAATVYFQIDSKQDFTTWVPYALCGIQQTILIIMLLYYQIRDWINPPNAFEVVNGDTFATNPDGRVVSTESYPLSNPYDSLDGLTKYTRESSSLLLNRDDDETIQ